MDQHLEEVKIFALAATRHPRQNPPQILAILTAHRAGTTDGATLLENSWQDRIILNQKK